MPSHPWYLVLAGKQPHVHRMGVKDVTWRQTHAGRSSPASTRRCATHRFSALVLDDRDLFLELPRSRSTTGPRSSCPPTSARASTPARRRRPTSIWVPAIAPHAADGREGRVRLRARRRGPAGQRSGPAWGDGPVDESLPGQDLVLGATGQRFATSMHGGDAGDRPRHLAAVRARRRAAHASSSAAAPMRPSSASSCGSTARSCAARERAVARRRRAPRGVDGHRGRAQGKQATLVLVDDSPTGHLDVDDVWLRER